MPSTERPIKRLGLLIVTGFALLWLLSFAFSGKTAPDEMCAVGDAWRVTHGQVMYRDFFNFLVPLSRWMAALLFTLSGPSLLAARLMQAVFLGLAGWISYRLMRRVGVDSLFATLPGLILIVALYPLFPYYSAHWLVPAFWYGAIWAAIARRWFDAGLLVGLIYLLMQSDGLVLAAAFGIMLLAEPLLGETSWRAAARQAGRWAGGIAIPLGLVAFYMASQGALSAAIEYTWFWPLAHYRTSGGINDIKVLTDISVITNVTVNWVNLPYWYIRTLFFVGMLLLPFFVLLGSIAWGLEIMYRRVTEGRRWQDAERVVATVALVAVGLTVLATRGRADSIHVAIYASPAFWVATLAAARLKDHLRGCGVDVLRWYPLTGLAIFTLMGAIVGGHDLWSDPTTRPRAVSPDTRFAAAPAFEYVRSRARPGDRLIAFPYSGAFEFYALPSASRWSYILSPGEGYNTRAEYQMFWQEIHKVRPRFVIFHPDAPEEQGYTGYFEQPLVGYRRIAALSAPPFAARFPAYIYERISP